MTVLLSGVPAGRPELQFDRPVDRPRGAWDYVSASRLNLWLKCPLAFRLKYIDGEPMPTSSSQFIGKQVHGALERWYRQRQIGRLLTAGELAVATNLDWDAAVAEQAVQFTSTDDEAACHRTTVGLVTAYIEQIPAGESPPLAVEVAVESPLVDPATGEDLGIPLLGIMDLVLAEPAGPLVIDFKTVARGGEPLEITHEVQLSAYSYLFRQAHGQHEAGLEIRNLIKTKTPKIEAHRYPPRNNQHFGRFFAIVRAYLDALDRGKFVFRPSLLCSSCEFCDTHCRRWAG